jgi:beta-glucosidase
LPRKTIQQPPPPVKNGVLSFKVDYNIEGAAVGYKWYEEKHLPVLFPFGFGLSYTTFKYSGLTVNSDGSSVSVTVTNTGARAGAEIAEVYAALPESASEPWKRLIAYKKVDLGCGGQAVDAAQRRVQGDGRTVVGRAAAGDNVRGAVGRFQ